MTMCDFKRFGVRRATYSIHSNRFVHRYQNLCALFIEAKLDVKKVKI